jgi:hypothetical protein
MKERSGCLSRRKSFIFTFFLIWSVSVKSLADGFPFPIGARSWGIGNASVARSDYSSVSNNIAGLGGFSDAVFFSTYDSHYGFDGIHTLGFGGVLPVGDDLSTGFSVQRFGDKLYNELALGVGAGHRIGRVSLGLRMNYLQNAVNANTLTFSRKALVFEFGGIVQLSSQLFFGAHVFNLTQSSYSGDYGSRVPTALRAGFSYSPQKNVQFSTEIEKNTDLPVSAKAGLEYQVWKQLFLRTGIVSRPWTHHFGAGFKGRQFQIDYAVHTHPQLGWSHHISLAYHVWERKVKDRK